MCVVTQHLTLEFKRLVMLLKSCSGEPRLLQALLLNAHTISARLTVFADTSASKAATSDTRALPVLILIVALLCEHCNFDELRGDHSPVTDESLTEIRHELAGLTKVNIANPGNPT